VIETNLWTIELGEQKSDAGVSWNISSSSCYRRVSFNAK